MKAVDSTIRFQVAARIDMGRLRERQEDHFGLCVDVKAANWSFTADTSLLLPELGSLLVVADGMGGQNAGQEASRTAVAAVRTFFQPCSAWSVPPAAPGELLKKAAVFAHQEVVKAATADSHLQGMGTTLVMLWWLADRAYICWVGDSRCYLFRDGRLSCLSKDHSYVQHLIHSGALSPEEAEHFPHRNVIMQSLGQAEPPRPDLRELQLQPADLLLLCSDGLNGMLSDAQIASLAGAGDSPARLAGNLVEAANAAGGQDNITVVLAAWLPPAAEGLPHQTAEPVSDPAVWPSSAAEPSSGSAIRLSPAKQPDSADLAAWSTEAKLSSDPAAGLPLATREGGLSPNRREPWQGRLPGRDSRPAAGRQLPVLLLLGLSLLVIGIVLSVILFFSWQQEGGLQTAQESRQAASVSPDTLADSAPASSGLTYVLQVNAYEELSNAQSARAELQDYAGLSNERLIIYTDSSQSAPRYYKLLIVGFGRREEADSFRLVSKKLQHALVVPASHFSFSQ